MTRNMTRGIIAGLVAAAVLVGVGAMSYRVGMHHDPMMVRGSGDVVRVVGGWHGGWHGGAPFGLFFFLVLAGLVIFAVSRHHRYGVGPYGPGWWGPGPGSGHGPGPGGEGREAMLAEWHRRAHQPDAGDGDDRRPEAG